MKKTTIYLPDDVKRSIEQIAGRERRSEAGVIRDAISAAIATRGTPPPRIPLFEKELSDPSIAERVDELLAGFGE